jgi:hypothetical protein
MERERRLLPVLAAVTGLAWMVAVLLVAANPKGGGLTADLAYDRANRVHTLALVFLLCTSALVRRLVDGRGLAGRRSAGVLVAGAALMLVGNLVSFWGALLTDGTSEQFWGGWAGWLVFLPGMVLLLGAAVALARAARAWPGVSLANRWSMGLFGLLLAVTTDTWAVSPAATLVPALLAAFALLATGLAVTQAAGSRPPTPAGPARPAAVVEVERSSR